MKNIVSRLLALVLVVLVGFTTVGCSSNTPSTLSGNYRQDTLALIETMRTALAAPEGSEEQATDQVQARKMINDYAARYRRDSKVQTLASFTTVRTALNSLAGHYSSYPNRPVPDKLKSRLEREFKQAELALKRGA